LALTHHTLSFYTMWGLCYDQYVCPFVCLSVAFVLGVTVAKCIVKLFTTWRQSPDTERRDEISTTSYCPRALNAGGVWNAIFSQYRLHLGNDTRHTHVHP